MPAITLIDISRALHSGAPHWPGDTPTRFQLTSRIADGAPCNVGQLSLSVHNGTHVDAPFHYNDRGLAIDGVALESFVGPARVIDARGWGAFTVERVADACERNFTAAPRLLFRTDTWNDASTFPSTWPCLDPQLPEWLAQRGVKLIGLDVPSVDALDANDMPLHRQLDRVNVLILESLDLRGVEAGMYELIALPLKLKGADGSPVRAVLRR